MPEIESKRFIARSLFDGERFLQLQFVDMTGTLLNVAPFDVETAATIFLDSRVLLIDRRTLIVLSTAHIEKVVRDAILTDEMREVSARLAPYMAVSGVTPSSSVVAITV